MLNIFVLCKKSRPMKFSVRFHKMLSRYINNFAFYVCYYYYSLSRIQLHTPSPKPFPSLKGLQYTQMDSAKILARNYSQQLPQTWAYFQRIKVFSRVSFLLRYLKLEVLPTNKYSVSVNTFTFPYLPYCNKSRLTSCKTPKVFTVCTDMLRCCTYS